MKVSPARAPRSLLVALAALAAAGCGDDSLPDCEVAPALPPGQAFTLGGKVEYERVPATYDPATGSGTLAFAAAAPRPVRNATVEIRQCDDVLATTTTDDSGLYSVTFTPGETGRLYVMALAKTTTPPIRVVDNTDANALWAVGRPIDSASPTLDVLATHGWEGPIVAARGAAGYDPRSRIAAPFAILDSMYTASRRLIDAVGAVPFPPLEVNWSPANYPSGDLYAPSSGAIVTSHFDGNEIYVLGAAGIDTDEFDDEVIVHEWAHYFEDNLSRSDSPGGAHGLGDVLDPRLAFGEGFASAFAAILLDQPVYADTFWIRPWTIRSFGWNAETAPVPGDDAYPDDPFPGPFSEMSVIRAFYDLYDTGTNENGYDTSAVGLGPIYDTLVGPERTTPALTTLASFVMGLKAELGADTAARNAVNAVLAHYSIGPIASEWGDGDADLRAMFVDVTVPGTVPSVLLNANYYWNEQPQNRYFVFTAPGTSATVTATSSEDVDLYLYASGQLLDLDESRSATAQVQHATVPGQVYVIVLTGWGDRVPFPGDYSAALTFESSP